LKGALRRHRRVDSAACLIESTRRASGWDCRRIRQPVISV
jgi:hypothetical protein